MSNPTILSNPTTFSDLPDEIIEHILKYLSINSLVHKSEVCRQWNSICPKPILEKSMILDNKINFERNEKYNIYDGYSQHCMNANCTHNRIGYAIIYFPKEKLPEMTEEELENQYYGPMDYPIYRYDNPFGDYSYMFRKLEICQRGPHIKHNLLYCSSCIEEFKIIPDNSTYGTYYVVA